MAASFDPNRHYLGALCKNSHRWQDTNQSQRLLSNRGCVVCAYEQHAVRNATPEGKEIQRKSYKKYNESEHGRAKREAYKQNPNFSQMMATAQLKYRQTDYGKATRKRAENKYAQTEGRRISWRRKDIKRKKLKKGTHEFYGPVEKQQRWSLFGNSCAYCGCTNNLTIDHFVALNRNGADAIWNIVPACYSCNASKQDDDAESWYKNKPFYSETRWQLILSVMGGR